jgi:hypothetical protein
MSDKPPSPADISDEVAAMSLEWPMITGLLGGTGAMRAAGEKYLPKHPAEDSDGYKYRKAVSVLFNGFRRTVETMASKPFTEPLKLKDDVPPKIEGFCEDIDLEGRNLQAFANDVFDTAMAFGLSHILVDYPPVAGGQTLAEQRTSGARPYFVHIKPTAVLGWRSERIAGVETLLMLRLDEMVSEPDGEFGAKAIRQIRVLEQTRWRTFRKNEREEWVLYQEGVVSLGCIPLVTVYTGRTGFMQGRPPLLDLAYLNVAHWQSDSDQTNILHVARVPILFAAGFDKENSIAIGAGVAVKNDRAEAKLTYVEHTGAAIEAGRESLKDMEDRMSMMGAQLLVRRQVAATATEKAIDSNEADSLLTGMALGLQDSLEQALALVAKWEGLDAGGSVEVCTDYCESLDGMSVEELMRARELGVLSAETVFGELQRRGIINEDLDWEKELAQLKKEGPPQGIKGSFETGAGGGGGGE